ncbi:MAG TPA: PIN domain-containing protein [Chloroflexia bacterium]
MIFVDTGALFAYAVPDDEHHKIAQQWVRQNRVPLITTDYIIDEILTLLRARKQSARATQIGELLFGGRLAKLYYLAEDDILASWQVFRTYSDKEWSFTDCTSKVVIDKLRLTHAFSFDQHFRQFGAVVVVP